MLVLRQDGEGLGWIKWSRNGRPRPRDPFTCYLRGAKQNLSLIISSVLGTVPTIKATGLAGAAKNFAIITIVHVEMFQQQMVILWVFRANHVKKRKESGRCARPVVRTVVVHVGV